MTKIINTNNFEELITGDKLVLVDFSANWCAPCKALSPIIDSLSENINDSEVIIGKLDIETDVEIANKYGIKSIPTIILFRNGEIVEKNVGSISKVKLEEMINNHL